jgi:predicted GNAT superfamily acetyltransferase
MDAVADAAARVAQTAAEAAGVVIAEVHDIERLREINRVIDTVWHRDGDALAIEMLRALAHSGNCVLGAWAGTEMVGACVAFRGLYDGRPCLHSHITGIVPGRQLRGAGRALKLRQRAWALAGGVDTITWTFDPLVARNGRFNLTTLGADADEYLVDFYGPLRDSINSADVTDRLLAVWRLTGPRVARALTGRSRIPPAGVLLGGGDPVVLGGDADGLPVPGAAGADTPVSNRALVRVPDDILAVRRRDPGCADAWRVAVRNAMTGLFARGLRPFAAVAPGWYVFGPAGADWPE